MDTKTVQGVGMQALVDAVQGTGAKNIVIVWRPRIMPMTSRGVDQGLRTR